MSYKRMSLWREGLLISVLIAVFSWVLAVADQERTAGYQIIARIIIGPLIIQILNIINGFEK